MKPNELKGRQDRMATRSGAVLEAFEPFITDFQARLCGFISEALEAGVTGVSGCIEGVTGDDVREVEFSLREQRLVLSVPSAVHQTAFGGPLAAKAFLYPAGNLEHTPVFEIAVVEDYEGLSYRIGWNANGMVRPVAGDRIADGGGSAAADAFLEFFYGLELAWVESPSRKSLHRGEGLGPIGFQTDAEASAREEGPEDDRGRTG